MIKESKSNVPETDGSFTLLLFDLLTRGLLLSQSQ